jgi:hypothetical protein
LSAWAQVVGTPPPDEPEEVDELDELVEVDEVDELDEADVEELVLDELLLPPQ